MITKTQVMEDIQLKTAIDTYWGIQNIQINH